MRMKRTSHSLLFLALLGSSALHFASEPSAHAAAQATVESAKPKYGKQATRLHDSHDFIVKTKAADYWALSPYYAPQIDGRVCIIASFAMALNALRADQHLGASDNLVTQAALLKFLTSFEGPAKRFYSDHGKSVGVAEQVGMFQAAAKEFLHRDYKVDVMVADVADKAFTQKIEKVLIENEASAKNMVIANFLQSEYTGDPEGAVGHVAPVGGYDAKLKRVLILDPDREYYEPYWVSLDTFVKGLATLDSDSGKNRGIIYVHE
jgi:hypothetical protein